MNLPSLSFTTPFTSRRSNIIAHNGLVATSQPLAAQAGLNVLQAGGNAIDAAIATVATLCVVEPCSTGIGGDAFALIWMAKEKKLFGLNASGPAPAGLTAAWIRQQGHRQMPALGGIPVTVPGSLRGWELALNRFGTMGLDTLLQRPITYARDGFPVSEIIAQQWHRSTAKMSQQEDSKRVWLPRGRAPLPGELFQNPEFARTLEIIAGQGVQSFYEGEIAAQIVQAVQQGGGMMTVDDLAQYRAEWVEPISLEYRPGVIFHQIPPNGQGLTTLIALNILRGYDFAAMDATDRLHLQIEAVKLAFADAHRFIADPRQADIPLAGLLSESYAAERRHLIRLDDAVAPTPGNPWQHGDTVYLTVADGQGNMVSWIQSLYMGFGSGLTAGTTGVQLQNRGANFSLEPGHVNEAGPGKRPYNTIIPGFITRQGEAWASFGVMGGFMQPQGQVQVGMSLIEDGLSPQAALDRPRFCWQQGREVALESVLLEEMGRDLRGRNHILIPPGSFGGGQVILRDPDSGVLIGGSEPRNDGTAVGW
ncbi:MAG: gamma-glutamyltransferase [Anaerolineae bacterium]|nr:gamma-glutamyltransferase [Anaerolineae bacterium]